MKLSIVTTGCIIALLGCIPFFGALALHFDVDRPLAANGASICFSVALNLFFVEPLFAVGRSRKGSLAVPSLRESSLRYLVTSVVIHLTWEAGWLCLHQQLPTLKDSLVGYIWYVYIDAGDSRYLEAPVDLLSIELLSVFNGIWGLLCLLSFRSSRSVVGKKTELLRRRFFALLGFGMMATVHCYSASLYYLSEALSGFQHCDKSSPVNVFFAFFLANVPWVYMPFVVWRWILLELEALF